MHLLHEGLKAATQLLRLCLSLIIELNDSVNEIIISNWNCAPLFYDFGLVLVRLSGAWLDTD